MRHQFYQNNYKRIKSVLHIRNIVGTISTNSRNLDMKPLIYPPPMAEDLILSKDYIISKAFFLFSFEPKTKPNEVIFCFLP